MKILFCLGGLEKGGAERVASNLCNFFISKNHDVEILATRIDNIAYEFNDKIKIKSLEETQKKENQIIRNYRLIKKMKQEVYDYNPDIIISFLKEPTTRILFLKKYFRKIKRIPLIISIRVDPKAIYSKFPYNLLVKLLYNSSDGYIFQTDEAKEFFNKTIQNRSTIIPNPINESFLIEPFNGARKKVIVSVGRLAPQKNYKLLIDSFEEVNKKYPEYKLHIYGEGPLKDQLKKYILSKKLENEILLKGIVDDIKKEIYDATMFVLSSDYEGISNALMEAMALGLPCISTDSSGGGSRFLIENEKNGILVPMQNKEQLVKAIIKIIEDKEYANKLGNSASKKMKPLSQKNINKLWVDYILKIKERQ